MKHNFPNKIIFLDVDGVINIIPDRFLHFNENCLNNLQEIIDKTGAKIVVSSSWRDKDTQRMKANFLEHGFTEKLWSEIIDITVRGYTYTIKGSNLPIVRGNEIKQWIDTKLVYPWHSDSSLQKQYEILKEDGSFKIMNSNKLNEDFSYLILDDDTDMLYNQRSNFINTDANFGITKEITEQAIKILNYENSVS